MEQTVIAWTGYLVIIVLFVTQRRFERTLKENRVIVKDWISKWEAESDREAEQWALKKSALENSAVQMMDAQGNRFYYIDGQRHYVLG